MRKNLDEIIIACMAWRYIRALFQNALRKKADELKPLLDNHIDDIIKNYENSDYKERLKLLEQFDPQLKEVTMHSGYNSEIGTYYVFSYQQNELLRYYRWTKNWKYANQ